jgi:hypothetical protein
LVVECSLHAVDWCGHTACAHALSCTGELVRAAICGPA